MARKQDIRALLVKELGEDVADAMLNKVDQMVKQGKKSIQIEKAFSKDLATYTEKQMRKTARIIVHMPNIVSMVRNKVVVHPARG